MRRSLIAVVATLTLVALIAVARVAWTAADAEGRADRNPEIAAARALVRARNDSLLAWALAERRASVLAAAATLRPSPAAFAIETRGAVSARTRAAYAAEFAAELQALPPSRVPIRVVLMADTGVRAVYSFGTWYIRPQRAGEACIVAMRAPERVRSPSVARRDLQRLGPCGLYAIAGLPGPGIARWLDSTQARSALSYRPPTAREPVRVGLAYSGSHVVELLGPLACGAGRDAACAPALLTPDADQRSLPRVGPDVGRVPVQAYAFELDDFPGNVVAAIRAELGDERFAQWWASELPPDAAYERITGRRFARFAQALLRPYIGRKTSGPLTAGLPLVLGVLLAIGAASWAVVGTPRART